MGAEPESYADRVRRLALAIRDLRLCEFTGKLESEAMIQQTMAVALRSLQAGGEPRSPRGDGVLRDSQCGLVHNRAAYRGLLRDGLLREQPEGDLVYLYPTAELLDRLERWLLRHTRDSLLAAEWAGARTYGGVRVGTV